MLFVSFPCPTMVKRVTPTNLRSRLRIGESLHLRFDVMYREVKSNKRGRRRKKDATQYILLSHSVSLFPRLQFARLLGSMSCGISPRQTTTWRLKCTVGMESNASIPTPCRVRPARVSPNNGDLGTTGLVPLVCNRWLTPMDRPTYLALEVVAGVFVALACLRRFRQGVSPESLLLSVAGLCVGWMTAFGPATEAQTYVQLAPIAAVFTLLVWQVTCPLWSRVVVTRRVRAVDSGALTAYFPLELSIVLCCRPADCRLIAHVCRGLRAAPAHQCGSHCRSKPSAF